MKKSILATAICATLVMPALWSSAVMAQDATDKKKDDAQNLEKIVVTGSLIPQSQIETASPVIQITASDIEKRGFRNIYDALRSQPLATGAVQDNQFSGGFTPGASAVSLLGLSPSYTLVLVNGHPLADYPLLYNGQSNFADISSIPIAMVDHIDIVPGNQSSIYGSNAIAGVVNIILKSKIDGIELNVRTGGYSDGGGQNQRVQLTGGSSIGGLDLVWGVQYGDQHAIYGFQRDFADSTNDNPNPAARYGSRTVLESYLNSAGATRYQDPGAAACNSLSYLYNGSTSYDFRPGRGNFCGSRQQPGYTSLLNSDRSGSGYVSGKYQLNDSAQLYGDVLYNVDSVKSNSGSRFWQSSVDTGGYIWDPEKQRLESFQHIFAPEETGGLDTNAEKNLSRSYSGTFGVRGSIGGSDWDYDAFYSRSGYQVTNKQLWPLKAAVENFFRDQFLGPQLGEYYGYPVYTPNRTNYYKGLTPAQYLSFQGQIRTRSTTYTQDLNAHFTNTQLFDLPAGPVGFAGVLTAGDQSWENPTDRGVINGDYWGLTGTQGGGDRDKAGVAAEFRIPVFSMLTANVSGRYDRYKWADVTDSKPTYKVGLEFRPIDSLLFRGNYATAFRAPDLGYLFAGQSGFYQSVIDYYRCHTQDANTPLEDCRYNPVQVFGQRKGNVNLNSESAKSFGYGVVWSPDEKLSLKVDYYNVKIKDEVSDISTDYVLKNELACRTGQLDINSALCVDTLARVVRTPANAPNPNALTTIYINPINTAKENLEGITAEADYRFEAGRFGDFTVSGQYNVTLDHKSQQNPLDPEIDLLRNPYYSSEFKNILTGTLTWDIGNWTTTLTGTRYGSTPNYAAQTDPSGYAVTNGGKVGPYMLYNGSVRYNFDDKAMLGLTMNNIKNSQPPKDPTYTAYPYYNIFNYNGYGRAIWLELNVKFGGTPSK